MIRLGRDYNYFANSNIHSWHPEMGEGRGFGMAQAFIYGLKVA